MRGGRKINSGVALKRIKLIREGALIKRKDTGSIATLRKSPPHLRYGKAFALPISENFMEKQ